MRAALKTIAIPLSTVFTRISAAALIKFPLKCGAYLSNYYNLQLKSLLHLGQNIITFRTLLHSGSFITFRPSTDALFCSTCGESLQVSFKFSPKCGEDLANNKEIKVRNETSGKKNLSFKEFKETKEKQRATFFRKKPGRGKGSGKQQGDLSDIVKINIGIMVPDSGLRRV